MGTRNLTVVIKEKKPVIAQYGQWDGYPSGQGTTVLNFLKSTDIAAFTKRLEKVRFPNEDDVLKEKLFLESIGVGSEGWMDSTQSEKWKAEYPFHSRDHAAEVLNMIMDTSEEKEIVVQDNFLFAADSLFCEWAYIVNLDTQKLEVYGREVKEEVGTNTFEVLFQEEPYKSELAKEKKRDGYGIVPLTAVFDIHVLPTEDEFLTICDPAEDEE